MDVSLHHNFFLIMNIPRTIPGPMQSTQLSSIQDGIIMCALKSPYALHPVSQKFPQRFFVCETVPVFV